MDGEEQNGNNSAINQVEAFLSIEMVNVLQLVGFNFKDAIGKPLTQLLADWIAKQSPQEDSEIKELELLKELKQLELIQDPEACRRLQEFS